MGIGKLIFLGSAHHRSVAGKPSPWSYADSRSQKNAFRIIPPELVFRVEDFARNPRFRQDTGDGDRQNYFSRLRPPQKCCGETSPVVVRRLTGSKKRYFPDAPDPPF